MYYYSIFIGFDLYYGSFPHIICILGWTSRLHLKVKIKNEILAGRRASGDEYLQIQIICGRTSEIRQDKADYIQHVTTSLPKSESTTHYFIFLLIVLLRVCHHTKIYLFIVKKHYHLNSLVVNCKILSNNSYNAKL